MGTKHLGLLVGMVLLAFAGRTAAGEAPAREAAITVVFEPRQRATLSAEVTARVTDIAKEFGEAFQQDEPLIQLDSRYYERALRKARSLLALTQANLASAQALYDLKAKAKKAAADLAVAKAKVRMLERIKADRLRIRRAEAVLKTVQKNLEATEKLFADRAASEMDLETARTDVISAEVELALIQENEGPELEQARQAVIVSEIDQRVAEASRGPALELARKDEAVAQVNVDIAADDLAACSLLAPFPGRVSKVYVNEHELVDRGTRLLEIVNDRVLWAQFLLPSRVFGRVRTGQTVSIRVVETETAVRGVISHISASIDPASESFEVYATVKNADGGLRSGMRGRFTLSDIQQE